MSERNVERQGVVDHMLNVIPELEKSSDFAKMIGVLGAYMFESKNENDKKSWQQLNLVKARLLLRALDVRNKDKDAGIRILTETIPTKKSTTDLLIFEFDRENQSTYLTKIPLTVLKEVNNKLLDELIFKVKQ